MLQNHHIGFVRRGAALIIAAVLLCAVTARAQTGPSIIVNPWQEQPHFAETTDDITLVTGGHTKGDDFSIKTLYYDSYGRVKLDKENANPDFSLGYRVLTMEIGGNHPVLPGGATDVSVVGAIKLGRLGEDWDIFLIGGAGSANDNHFGNGDAVYGIGDVHAAKKLDDSSSLHLGLNYHGNRTFLPDIPLPYASYQKKVDDNLAFVLGVPGSSVVWKPWDNVTLEFEYFVPINVSGRASLHLTKDISIFGEYKQTLDAFWLHQTDNRRLFYDAERVSVGVRWINKYIDVAAGVGYAFDQRYSHGWDVLDLDTVAEPSDEILVFVRLLGTF